MRVWAMVIWDGGVVLHRKTGEAQARAQLEHTRATQSVAHACHSEPREHLTRRRETEGKRAEGETSLLRHRRTRQQHVLVCRARAFRRGGAIIVIACRESGGCAHPHQVQLRQLARQQLAQKEAPRRALLLSHLHKELLGSECGGPGRHRQRRARRSDGRVNRRHCALRPLRPRAHELSSPRRRCSARR